ncbi:hypothetical protein [Streptomyces erythrochromogenes]|uniref:hypothetical protein n=1 Tax=Streptomyces erythrochromogenes TaxID=285574 RepID=UPI0004CD2348|nr:hypothetical protein [Streptomyces erythrochromogenes]
MSVADEAEAVEDVVAERVDEVVVVDHPREGESFEGVTLAGVGSMPPSTKTRSRTDVGDAAIRLPCSPRVRLAEELGIKATRRRTTC